MASMRKEIKYLGRNFKNGWKIKGILGFGVHFRADTNRFVNRC